MTIAHTLKNFLDNEQVPYELVAHRHTATSLRSANTAHVDPARLAKAVLLEQDLERSHFVVAVVPASHRLQLGEVGRRLGCKVHLATEDDAATLFEDCETGAIPALGPAYGIDTIVEDSLLAQAQVYFEAGDHEHLVRMARRDFLRLLGDCPHGHIAK
ncbi:MAG TPA: YbaK/EbsC family protein [Burkholderiales bacterium]|nr:YbaK/EbsC family protein [Burkholderiales bacterium]